MDAGFVVLRAINSVPMTIWALQLTTRNHPANFYWQMQDYLSGTDAVSGDKLLQVLGTLANPHRMRVVAALAERRNYVSRLARELGISRALLQVHLRKLEAAGLVSASIEVSADGKAMKFYEVAPFALHLTPESIMTATRTLSTDRHLDAELR
jgi:DNA-binding transcriptional ArsR family regulator